MAKYNLLDDDDIFDDNDDLLKDDSDDDVSGLLQETKEQPGAAGEPPVEEEAPAEAAETAETDDPFDIDIDEDLLNYEPAEDLDESAFSPETDLEITSEEEPLEPEISIDPDAGEETQAEAVEEKKPAPKPIPDLEIEDEKQEGISYKPIVKGLAVILFLILAYAGVDYFFLTDEASTADSAPVTEQQEKAAAGTEEGSKKSAAEIAREKKAREKQAYLNTISSENRARIASVEQVVSATGTSARLSSVLLYDNSMTFEVFAKNRGELAKYNINLKRSGSPFKIISSSARPGQNGGILGVFKTDKPAPASGAPAAGGGKTFSSIKELENWLSGQVKASGLRTLRLKSRPAAQWNTDLFRGYRLEAELSGSLAASKKLLSALKGASQVKIYKLVETAKDQQNFSGNRYRIQLILQAFI